MKEFMIVINHSGGKTAIIIYADDKKTANGMAVDLIKREKLKDAHIEFVKE